MAPRLKEIKQVHEKVHETFDFPEIESVMILCFYLKASKKTVVSIRTRKNLLSGDLFSEKVGGRLPNKKKRQPPDHRLNHNLPRLRWSKRESM